MHKSQHRIKKQGNVIPPKLQSSPATDSKYVKVGKMPDKELKKIKFLKILMTSKKIHKN
jgi:hypothetical protein